MTGTVRVNCIIILREGHFIKASEKVFVFPQVAGFLSDAIIQSYRVSLGDAAGDEELFFDPGENFADFHQIVRLCQEPSLLGDRLLGAVAAMADRSDQISDKGNLDVVISYYQ